MRALLLLATATLAGCGGSDGGGGTPPFSIAVNFDATQGSPPPAAQFVAFPSYGGSLASSQSGSMFTHWLAYPTGVTITPAAPTDIGTFTGTITVNSCSIPSTGPCNRVAGTIDVTYRVHGLSVTPAYLIFSSTTGTDPEVQTASLAITGDPEAYTWQINYSPSVTEWLQVRPASGTPDLSHGPQTLNFNVNAAGLRAGVHSATVTFSTASGFRAPVTVTLSVADPRADFVAPYVVTAGSGGKVILRGHGFSALSPESLSVQFNSTPALSATVVSDTEIRATHPPLAAGSYSIAVSSGAASIPSRAALKLVVMDPPAFPLTTIARPGRVGTPADLIYDAERRALLFTDSANDKILRYALAEGGSTSLENLYRVGQIALSTDGTELVRASPWGQLVRHDPVTLAVLSSVGPLVGSPDSIAFANDGGAIGSGTFLDDRGMVVGRIFRYDMLTQAITPIASASYLRYRPLFASADGRTFALPFLYGSATDTRVYTYDASTRALVARPVITDALFRGLRLSRNGSRIILANFLKNTTGYYPPESPTTTTVYDAEFNALGTLPDGPTPFIPSPDGNFAYAYYSAEGRVRKFNIGGPGGVTEVGSGSVVAPAYTLMSEMTISPDGGTLFLAGQTSVVIAPAP